jgi:DNA uptake protein ComE-like DNA-binding protein
MKQVQSIFRTLLVSCVIVGVLAACSSNSAATLPEVTPTTAPAAVSTAAPESSASTTSPTGEAALPETSGEGSQTAAIARHNLNTASADDFLTVPNVGNRMVREFMEYRPYVSIEQFRREIGKYVSADQVAAYEQYVYVPIAVNEADADTLQQIPGLDAAEAEALIAARPFASQDAFLSSLAQYVSPEELAAAGGYLESE